MRDLEELILNCQSTLSQGPTQDELLPALLRLVSLVKEETLHGELMTPYRDLADHFKASGDFSEALVYARLELEEEVVCLGEGSEVVRSTRKYIADLETAVLKRGEGMEEKTGEGS